MTPTKDAHAICPDDPCGICRAKAYKARTAARRIVPASPDLITLVQWMVDEGFDSGEIGNAMEKPWVYAAEFASAKTP